MRLLAVFFVCVLSVAVVNVKACSTDEDCSLNGVCKDGACECDAAWTASDCGMLAFEPAPVSSCGPACAYHGSGPDVTTSWGGSVHYHKSDQKYYMFMAEMINNCTLGSWQRNSRVSVAISATPVGPYTWHSQVVQPWAHNPQLVVAPDGTFVLYTLGNGTQFHGAPEQCTTDTAEHLGRQSSEAAFAPLRDDSGNTTVGFTIHYSSGPTGPWQALNASILMFPTIDNLANWNPAPIMMPSGEVRVMVHTDPKPWAGETIVSAPSWRGPYTPITSDITTCDHCEEDPFMWTDVRGNWHALFHRMFDPPGKSPIPSPGWCGGHAFSSDGLHWSNISRAYNTSVLLEGGGQIEMQRRERPKLLFDASGNPTHLFNGVQTATHGTYTMVAPLRQA